MSQTLPITILDASGFIWDIQTDGRIAQGTQDAFDAGLDNPDLRPSSEAELALDGRQLILRAGGAISAPGISLERWIYVPADDSWARFIDTATNTSDAPITYSMRLLTNFGSDASSRVIASSSGDTVLGADDRYFINDDTDPDAGDPQVGLAFGDGSSMATFAAYTSVDIAEITFEVTLAPGESASVLSFAAQSQFPADLAALMTTLGGAPSQAMSYGISQEIADSIINYDVTGFVAQVAYFGNDYADVLIGSERDEQFLSLGGADVILAGAGRDTVEAGYGADVVSAGAGDDHIMGGGDADVLQGEDGADVIVGDGHALRASAKALIAETGLDLAVSVVVPEANDSGNVWIDGAITRQPFEAAGLNLVYIIDTSSTMNSVNTSATLVGDLNGDGLENRLIDIAIAGFNQVSEQLILSGLAASDLAVIAYDIEAEIVFQGAVGTFGSDVLDGVPITGNTSFEAPLVAAASVLSNMGDGQNHVLFLTDGAPTDGAAFTDDVAGLIDPNGLDATIRAVGLGAGASVFHLDLVDDGVLNVSATRITTPSEFFDAFFPDPVAASEIAQVAVLVNGSQSSLLDPAEFEITPLGLRFRVDVSGLTLDEDDQVTVAVTASDGESTVLEVALTIPEGADSFGADTISGGAGRDVLQGDAGDDVLLGDTGDDILEGGRGADYLIGDVGDDVLLGGLGDDVLFGGAGADTLIGGPGDDLVSYAGSIQGVTVDLTMQTATGGDAVGDLLSGITGVVGTAQRDVLIGTEDPNVFRPGLGDDDIYGDANFDLVDYSDVTGGIYVTLQIQSGAQDAWAAGFDTLNNIDGLIGTQFDDYLIGDSSYNEISGGAGRDIIKSKGGNDRLDGGSGPDKITGDVGHEHIVGGSGDDELYGLTGLDTIYGGSGADYVSGGKDADEIYGQGGADTLRGNIGFDTIYGGRGADDIRGGGGGDLLLGEQGDDFILGENGDDTLSGGSGDDVLQGGAGADVFQFEPGGAFDEARDFEDGVDFIDVSAFGLQNLAAVQALAEDRSSGLRIEFGGNDIAFITGLFLDDLQVSDLIF